jgi:DNA polymerase-3 subunit alpha
VQPLDEAALLNYEKEALGFYISGHPIDRYRRTLSAMDIMQIADIEDRDERADVCVAGNISEIRRKTKEKGITAYLTVEDETAITEAIVFNELYRKNVGILTKGSMIMIKGQVFRSEKGAKVMAREIQNLNDIEISTKYEIDIDCIDPITAREKLNGIKKLMETAPNGRANGQANGQNGVSFRLFFQDYSVIISTQLKPSDNFAVEAERIGGVRVKVS